MSGGERGMNPAAIAFVNPWKEILAQPEDQNSDTLFLTHYHTIQHIDSLEIYIAVENIVRKGEIACKKQISPFLTMFSTFYGTYFSF